MNELNNNIKDLEFDLINLLIFENKIQRKKLKKQKLTDKEIIFDFMIPPSIILEDLIKRLERNEKKCK